MAKKLLSFLGNSFYLVTKYSLDKQTSKPHHFIQAALAELICKNWTKDDKICIFLTAQAEKDNWKHPPENWNLINKRDPKSSDYNYKGLEKDLADIGTGAEIISINDIPQGLDQENVWQIFNQIIDNIEDDDELYFDITHGFRFLPMLALVALDYASIVKHNVKVRGIYYGAFEVLVKSGDVKKMPVDERIAPIFDLTAIETLQRWAMGVDRFIDTGDASLINGLVCEKKTTSDDPYAQLSESLVEFTKTIYTCRSREIKEKSKIAIERLKASIDTTNKEMPPHFYPMVKLFKRINEKLEGFCEDDIRNGLNAVKWCIEHNLVQQGYTIISELITTYLAKIHCKGKEKEVYSRGKRESLTGAMYASMKNLPEKKWKYVKPDEEGRKLVLEIKKYPNIEEIFQLSWDISKYRNDINHAGCRKMPKSANEIKSGLENFHKRASEILI